MVESVCVCLTSSREGLPSDAIPIAGQIHPPQRLQCHTPSRLRTSASPWGDLMGVCWVTHMGQQLGCLLESRPARHSVTLRCCLGHLPFLPLIQMKLCEAFETNWQNNWLGAKVANLWTGGRSSKTSTGSVWE